MTTMDTSTGDPLQQVQSLLDQDKPQDALDYLNHQCNGKACFHNARAVCQMRLGNAPQAVRILRPLVYPDGAGKSPADQPLYQANLAAALMAEGRLVAANIVLKQVREKAHPAVRKVRDVLDAWKKTLGVGERLVFWLGVELGIPCPVPIRPGSLA
ncbi:MAG TPA: hypothetical protein PKG77_24310 [Phycisphaerae bacterium]|nr:hypothetical protein [Phycisphaerae bacterium]HQL73368.1 hypothetical protein [Phycisphaerae bacterium]